MAGELNLCLPLPVAGRLYLGEDACALLAPDPIYGVLSGGTGPATGSLTASYDHRVARPTVAGTRAVIGGGARLPAHLSARWSPRQRFPRAILAPQGPAQPQAGAITGPWGRMRPLPADLLGRLDAAVPLQGATQGAWLSLLRAPLPLRGLMEHGQPLPASTEGAWLHLLRHLRPRFVGGMPAGQPLPIHRQARWGKGVRQGLAHTGLFQHGLLRTGWGGLIVIPPIPPTPDPECPPAKGRLELLADSAVLAGLLRLGCWRAGAVVIPTRRYYVVRPVISLIRVGDSADVGRYCDTMNFDINADSWAWSLRGTLAHEAGLALLAPDGGQPRVLEATLNGLAWRFLAEDWSETQTWDGYGVSVQGRSLTALLASPYSRARTYSQPLARTAQQLAAEELPYGWSLVWQGADWLVPGGAFSYQGLAPISAIGRVAQAAGGMVVPARAGQSLTLRPRYPVLPWEYWDATPALVIPEDAILSRSRRLVPIDQANAVYVHGGEVGGILARVYRAGSAGDLLAATVMDALCTHADAARALGSRLLAAQTQPPSTRSVTLPLDGDQFPLAELGDLIEIGGTTPERGVVSAISISVTTDSDGGVDVTQTLTLGEDVSPWARLLALLPTDPLLVGTIATTYGDGTVLVDLIGGGSMRVRGTGTVGAKVYLKGGQIAGEAPVLPGLEIEV